MMIPSVSGKADHVADHGIPTQNERDRRRDEQRAGSVRNEVDAPSSTSNVQKRSIIPVRITMGTSGMYLVASRCLKFEATTNTIRTMTTRLNMTAVRGTCNRWYRSRNRRMPQPSSMMT